jgi:hypothetical protein
MAWRLQRFQNGFKGAYLYFYFGPVLILGWSKKNKTGSPVNP